MQNPASLQGWRGPRGTLNARISTRLLHGRRSIEAFNGNSATNVLNVSKCTQVWLKRRSVLLRSETQRTEGAEKKGRREARSESTWRHVSEHGTSAASGFGVRMLCTRGWKENQRTRQRPRSYLVASVDKQASTDEPTRRTQFLKVWSHQTISQAEALQNLAAAMSRDVLESGGSNGNLLSLQLLDAFSRCGGD